VSESRDDDEVDRQLDEMTGDPAVTKHLRASLEKLRDGAGGPGLAEMAREVLQGRTTLREVARSSAYATEMAKVMADLREWNTGLTDRERERLAADATDPHQDPDREQDT
jgi:hypothetical protein